MIYIATSCKEIKKKHLLSVDASIFLSERGLEHFDHCRLNIVFGEYSTSKTQLSSGHKDF